MHRSRIGVVLVDHPDDRYDTTLDFWAGATGVTPVPEDDAPYASLGRIGTVALEAQRTGRGTPSRIHLDIETDDVDAEVDRLRGLGATIEERGRSMAVMRDPGGLVFCVVPVQTGEAFDADAVTWE